MTRTDKFSSMDVDKDIEDYNEAQRELPITSASTLTSEQTIEILNFFTDEIGRLNTKVWNLIKIVKENHD